VANILPDTTSAPPDTADSGDGADTQPDGETPAATTPPAEEPDVDPTPWVPGGGGATAGSTVGSTTGSGTGSTGGETDDRTDPDPDPDPGTDPDPDPEEPVRTAVLSLAKAPLDYLEIPRSAPVIGMNLSNTGDADSDPIDAIITLPAGLTFAPPAPAASGGGTAVYPQSRLASYMRYAIEGVISSGDWECTLRDDALTATCELPALSAGSDAELDLDLVVNADLAADAQTSFSVTSGEQSVMYSVQTGLEDNEEGVDVDYSTEGQVAAIHVGATLLGCDQTDSKCVDIMAYAGDASEGDHGEGSYNNNSWHMQPLNEAGGESNSASTTLVLPEGAKVQYALLEWSANRANIDGAFSGDTSAARLRLPGASTYTDITADTTVDTVEDGRVYYRSRLDITDLLPTDAFAGTWSLADVALPATMNDHDKTYYAGFALTVVYEDPSLTNSRVAIFDGAQWISSDREADVQFATSVDAKVTLGWTTWEADRGLRGDSLGLDDVAVTPLQWNGSTTTEGETDNAADSTAFGGKYGNTLGVDAKLFKPDEVEPGVHTVTVSTAGDNFLLSTLTVTIADE
jgi:hypothetical protein